MNNISVCSIVDLLGDKNKHAAMEAGICGVDVVTGEGSYSRSHAILFGKEKARFNLEQYDRAMKVTTQRYKPVYRVLLRDAVITGQGTLVTRNAKIVRESAQELFRRGGIPPGFISADGACFSLKSLPTRHIDSPCLLVKRPWWRNYGHWLVDGAALLALTSAIRMPSDWHIVIGAHESKSMRAVMQDTLKLIAPNIPVLEHRDNETWTFSQLNYITPVQVPPMFKSPEAMSSLRSLLLHQQLSKEGTRRLFIARNTGDRRDLRNQEDLIHECSRYGFEVIYPEHYSIYEQAKIFSSAEAIIGVKGAALTNIMFCTRPTGIMVLSPADWPGRFFWDIAGQSQLHYLEVFGNLDSDKAPISSNPFRIDMEDFRSALNLLIKRIDRLGKLRA
ncbi:glycosyltransferase family 61 protein [Nitrosomonas sp. Is37]|uniref:glycosyltransferase family 61 protein n=1 Tax=Nitrosomonas sp. Is37 TaxID=3080535 RepID=UPI00294AAC59|nr:glycosyltransferase family 61 protein [Nitrosomonas sp. Is37]MDV6344314.1 glycosyltransferase family 61 protein [Nitrosomonas sp. Is37]